MTSIELKERLEKAQAKVEKCKATIERHKKQAEKKLAVIVKNGWDPEDRWCRQNTAEHTDAYWTICEYQDKLSDIEESTKKLAEAERVAANWAEKYEVALQRELTLENEVPEAFKEARQALVDSWVAADIRERDRMLEKKQELSYEEFRKIWKYTEEEALRRTDEEFRRIEEAEADRWLLDLYNRVKEITGEITDASYIRWGGKCLDGYIVGVKGRASVTTIDAGGYNIQRWHLRTLVREY